MSRLVLIDTVDQLPGLLPLHAWTALSTTELVLLGDGEHPMAPHLDMADLRYEIVPEPDEPALAIVLDGRAISAPTTNNLFLDLVAGRIPVGPVGYDIRTLGTPESGFTFSRDCPGGFDGGFCMRSPFVPGMELPANASLLWNHDSNSWSLLHRRS